MICDGCKKIDVCKYTEQLKEFEKNNLIELHLYLKPGEKVEEYVGSNTTVGIMVVKFDSKEEMLEKIEHMDKLVKVILQ